MRLNMLSWPHVETSPRRSETRGPGTSGAGPGHEPERTARRPSRPFACCSPHHLGRNGGAARSESCQCARLQQRFREGLEPSRSPRRRWGGRRRALMTLEEEEAFLAPWVEQARTAGMLVVSPLGAALAEKLGRKVAPSVVYRLLARHGWRKVAPETRHPKSDPAAQA